MVHYEGKALLWHNAYVRTVGCGNLPSWKDYSQILLDRFGEVCEDPMTELMRLRQKGSMTEFHEQFDAIVSRVELAGEHQSSCLLGGRAQTGCANVGEDVSAIQL